MSAEQKQNTRHSQTLDSREHLVHHVHHGNLCRCSSPSSSHSLLLQLHVIPSDATTSASLFVFHASTCETPDEDAPAVDIHGTKSMVSLNTSKSLLLVMWEQKKLQQHSMNRRTKRAKDFFPPVTSHPLIVCFVVHFDPIASNAQQSDHNSCYRIPFRYVYSDRSSSTFLHLCLRSFLSGDGWPFDLTILNLSSCVSHMHVGTQFLNHVFLSLVFSLLYVFPVLWKIENDISLGDGSVTRVDPDRRTSGLTQYVDFNSSSTSAHADNFSCAAFRSKPRFPAKRAPKEQELKKSNNRE